MKNPRLPRRTAGFTLIEIMIVIAIIGLIATFVVPGVMEKFAKAQITTTEVYIEQLKGVVSEYRMGHGRVPDTLEELLEPSDKNLGRPYLDDPDKLKDAWENPFVYNRLSNSSFEIISLGADGLEGGDFENADISSNKSDRAGEP